MRRFLLIPICFVALLVPVVVLANGGGGNFDALIQTIETRYHVRATRIPMMGLVSFLAHRAQGGVSNLHVAEFEDMGRPVDPEELNQLVQQKLGPEWQPVIREIHRKPVEEGAGQPVSRIDSESVVFMRPEGDRMGMVVLDHDAGELDVVQLSVDPQHLHENVARYTHHETHQDDEDPH